MGTIHAVDYMVSCCSRSLSLPPGSPSSELVAYYQLHVLCPQRFLFVKDVPMHYLVFMFHGQFVETFLFQSWNDQSRSQGCPRNCSEI